MFLAPLEDKALLEHLGFVAPDGIVVFLLEGGLLRGSLLHGTRLVNQARANHGLGILETLILGHATMAAGLLTAMMKGEDRLNIGVDCTGPARGLSVESAARGAIRGYLKRNPIPLESPPADLDTSAYIGSGTLSVTKHLHGAPSAYTGQVELKTGSLPQDLAHYFLISEQMPTSFSLSVYFDSAGRVTGAAGLFLQRFPGVSPARIEKMEEKVRALPSLGRHFAYGGDGEELVAEGLGEFGPEVIGRREVRFECPCTRERFGRVLSRLKGEEARAIREEGPFPLQTVCHNCGTPYDFERREIEELMRGA